MKDIYSGIRILDLTRVFSGPFCTRLFADYGAEVIKIEHMEMPDDSRQFPPIRNGWSGYYEMLNRNKKGIALDLKSPGGKAHFLRLATSADVIVENLKPDTKHLLGIDYEAVRSVNPAVIYASLSGLGQNENRRYYDILAQAESGLMTLSGSGGVPMKIGPSVVDAFSGLMLAYGIAGALLYRQKTGKGQMLDVSMLGSSMQLLESSLTEASMTGANPPQAGNTDTMISPFGVYRAKDGFVAIAAGNDAQWEKLSALLSVHTVFDATAFSSNTLRLNNAEMLTRILESMLGKYSVTEAVEMLSASGIPVARVNTMLDVLDNKKLFASGDLIGSEHEALGRHAVPGRNIRFSLVATRQPEAGAPRVGQHNSTYDI